MALAFVGAAAVIFLISILAGIALFVAHPARGDLRRARALMFVFGRRAQKAAFSQVEGQPGAAGWVLGQHARRLAGHPGRRRLTAQLDAVHRVLGRPGVILVGEGPPHRVQPLLAQEKKRVARIVGDTPIYDVILGDGEGQVPIRKLNNHLVKLPRNLNQAAGQRAGEAAGGAGRDEGGAAAQGPDADQGPACPACERTLRRR